MIDVSKGRYWDKPWSCNLLCLTPRISPLSVGVRNIMFFGVAIKAKGLSVRYLIPKLREFRKLFEVMSVNISALLVSATAACEAVTLKDRHSPFSISGDASGHSHIIRDSTLPVWVMRTIKRTVSVCSFGLAQFAEQLFMRFSKRYSLPPFILMISFCKCLPHGFGYIWRLLFINTYTTVALHIKPVVTRFIRCELFSRLPFFTLLTALLCLTKQQIFIKRKAELPRPSSENSHSLRRYCFHDLSQYYNGGYCYVK